MIRKSVNIMVQRAALINALVFFFNYSGSGQGLIISSGTNFVADNGNVVIQENLVNNGSFTNNTSTIVFSGITQSLSGTTPILFNNLTVSSGSTTTITTAGQSLRSILLSNGTLNSNGNLTLLSTVSATALIDGSGTGQVNGNVTMQRYLPSGFGYKYFSSPFQGATVNEFGDDMNLTAVFSTFYKYDESRVSSGWVNYNNTAGVLAPLNGYAVNFGNSLISSTADVTGVVSNGTISRTMFNHNYTYTKGFNLAGNPYPSPINWGAASGWTKTNIDNALYYFRAGVTDQYTGTYSTYINGVSSDGAANNVIPSMQAFFIHVSDGSWPVTGTLAMNNNVRIVDAVHPFLKSSFVPCVPYLRISANFDDNPDLSDPMVVYFDENATLNFDGMLDALKLMNTDLMVPNLYTISSDGYYLSINALPPVWDSLTIVPVGIKTGRDGNIIIKLKETGCLPSGTEIYLYDLLTKTEKNLSQQTECSIFLKTGEYKGRFSIGFVSGPTLVPVVLPESEKFKIYYSAGILTADLDLPPGVKGTLIISNISGQLLYRKEIYSGGYQELSLEVKSGVYIVSYFAGKIRSTKKILIINK